MKQAAKQISKQETNFQQEQLNRELNQHADKENIYYGAMINAWLTTRMELDKHLLSLSSFAIGLLVTLATTTGFDTCYSQILGLISGLAFFATTFFVLDIFKSNSNLIISDVTGNVEDTKTHRQRLTGLDLKASLFFKLGVIFLIMTAVAVVVANKNKELEMTEKESQKQQQPSQDRERAQNSWDKISELKPSKPAPPPAQQQDQKK